MIEGTSARADHSAPLAQDLPPLARLRTVLVRTSLPANIGAAARAMLTMGLTRLVLVEPARFPHADATALAAGATEVLDRVQVAATLDQALEGTRLSIGFSARPREFAGRVVPLREAASEAVGAARDAEVALVFGTEMSGLSNAELARCTLAATIPANARYASLNLAAAVQVAAYELRIAAGGGEVWQAPRFERATHEEIEALHAHARRTLTDLRFLDPRRPRRLMQRLRRLFARAGLEREEVNILRGILARVDALCARRDESGEPR
ncbi:MAG TPA: TrmJ/YjtD family RNA methyltransferase [Casimicrobiaceae bacterium]|nr:TrmJ/YjtD family RNA methyltransferase [Casimicrobiaceae bacterium]